MTPTTEKKNTYNDAPDALRNKLKRAIMELTDEQTEYVLWRLQCLKQKGD